jgi:exosortase F-associated protein
MLTMLLKHKIRFFLVIALVILFALIRAYEDDLFYDPFLDYFKNDFHHLPLPEFNSFQLIIGLLFRYGLNTVISLGILYVLFEDIAILQFVSVLYVFFFLILISSFFVIMYYYGEHNKFILFYIRRFLIQPIFVLLFVPAFFYQKYHK